MRSPRWIALCVSASLLIAAGSYKVFNSLRPEEERSQPVDNVPQAPLLTGEVRDDAGPVLGARVRFQGCAESTNSDSFGRFRLPGSSEDRARVTAWKAGYHIGGTLADSSPLVIRLIRLPQEDCEGYAWVDSKPDPAKRQNCGNCHQEIYREWSESGHARSASNRHFLNLYEGTDWEGRRKIGWNLLSEYPDGAGVCTACHAPSLAIGDPAYHDLRKALEISPTGVHCDYCHKISDVAETDKIGLTHGRFGLKLLRPSHGQLFFGPLDDVDRGEDAFSPLYRESRYCASCHEGTVFGVHAYSTYSEWLQSPARQEGKQCQTCHMAATGTMFNIAPGKGGIQRDPLTLANHRFFTGSQAEMLRGSLNLSITVAHDPDGVNVTTKLQADRVGHRLPTGFPDRNLVLVVEAFGRADDAVTLREGPTLPAVAGKMLAGRAGRLFAKQLGDFDNHAPAPFWRAQPDFIDSRLFPGQVDLAEYKFPPDARRVRVRLLYRKFWEDIAIEKGWPKYEIHIVDHILYVKVGEPISRRQQVSSGATPERDEGDAMQH